MPNIINLESFAGGALAEKFNDGFQDVLKNIADPNTDCKKKRKLILELEFQPDEERELSMVNIKVKTKLAPPEPVATKILIDKDGKGNVIASEYNKQVKGQQFMRINEETGEILAGEQSEEIDTKGIKLIK